MVKDFKIINDQFLQQNEVPGSLRSRHNGGQQRKSLDN